MSRAFGLLGECLEVESHFALLHSTQRARLRLRAHLVGQFELGAHGRNHVQERETNVGQFQHRINTAARLKQSEVRHGADVFDGHVFASRCKCQPAPRVEVTFEFGIGVRFAGDGVVVSRFVESKHAAFASILPDAIRAW
jgi:hypothetical protein